MSKIVYLLGAGASFGKRDLNNPINLSKKKQDSALVIKIPVVNILEGLPIVSEIPERLTFVIEKIINCKKTINTKKTIIPINSTNGKPFQYALDILVNDLEWLKEECKNHATIDTFAKKLYLKGNFNEFYKVESLLSVFFIIEQIVNKKDGRYDTFLASVLNSDLNIDDRITILTWNYDSQFELAYREYSDEKDSNNIRQKLGIADLKDQSYNTRNQIFKLNGTANFINQIDISNYNDFNEDLLVKLLDAYFKELNGRKTNSRISFAWDDKELDINFQNALKDAIQDANTLVVIGYTFPFFNRKVDRMIFRLMENLKKIYIQDPNANNLTDNITPVLSHNQLYINKLSSKIELITNTTQFYLPPEL